MPGVVESFKVITREKSLRIAKFAFDYALEHNRKKVTCIHKANIMKLSDGLFKSCCQEVCFETLYLRMYFNVEFFHLEQASLNVTERRANIKYKCPMLWFKF